MHERYKKDYVPEVDKLAELTTELERFSKKIEALQKELQEGNDGTYPSQLYRLESRAAVKRGSLDLGKCLSSLRNFYRDN